QVGAALPGADGSQDRGTAGADGGGEVAVGAHRVRFCRTRGPIAVRRRSGWCGSFSVADRRLRTAVRSVTSRVGRRPRGPLRTRGQRPVTLSGQSTPWVVGVARACRRGPWASPARAGDAGVSGPDEQLELEGVAVGPVGVGAVLDRAAVVVEGDAPHGEQRMAGLLAEALGLGGGGGAGADGLAGAVQGDP